MRCVTFVLLCAAFFALAGLDSHMSGYVQLSGLGMETVGIEYLGIPGMAAGGLAIVTVAMLALKKKTISLIMSVVHFFAAIVLFIGSIIGKVECSSSTPMIVLECALEMPYILLSILLMYIALSGWYQYGDISYRSGRVFTAAGIALGALSIIVTIALSLFEVEGTGCASSLRFPGFGGRGCGIGAFFGGKQYLLSGKGCGAIFHPLSQGVLFFALSAGMSLSAGKPGME